jgi:methylenetetrahydrofolate--tRNA-(uracil-5-)-methyltransferase
LPAVGIVATGPLTSDALAESIAYAAGVTGLAFYDAIAPVLATESIDTDIAFRAARWDKETMAGAGEEGAYLNCPMNKDEYDAFIDALTTADQFTATSSTRCRTSRAACPIEEMARRGARDAAHGPMRPVGLRDPRTGKRPWAVVQLRREDAGRMWNLVGFQTRLRIPEQQRVFRMIPGLANAEFLRSAASIATRT